MNFTFQQETQSKQIKKKNIYQKNSPKNSQELRGGTLTTNTHKDNQKEKLEDNSKPLIQRRT